MSVVYFSREDRRRDAIAGRADLNGIDFVEVFDSPSLPLEQRQRTLFVHFINDPGALALAAGNVVIEGGERVTGVRVTNAAVTVDARSGDSSRAVLVVEVDRRGDFSTYTLRLVEAEGAPGALANFDPLLRDVDFSFKVNCPSEFDCQPSRACPPEARPEPAIDYLARDFNSLRQLLLDRLASISPAWRDRSVADLGVALVELLAYVGDQLSYHQDAVGTEAYLGTARRRISARRHARLVDYSMHDGCNARAWLQVRVVKDEAGAVILPARTQVLTALPNLPPLIEPGSTIHDAAVAAGAEVFETMSDAVLRAAHNRIRFYTWGARQSALPKGAVRATLRGALPDLQAGDFLLFREVCSPRSGSPDDAQFEHRHVVRLVEVTHRVDPVGAQFDEPPANGPVEVTDIRWDAEDALPFPLCISAEKDDQFGGGYVEDVTLAFGNLVLADHGLTRKVRDGSGKLVPLVEDFDPVPKPTVARVPAEGDPARAEEDHEDDDATFPQRRSLSFAPVRFAPALQRAPLTQAAPLPKPQEDEPESRPSARAFMNFGPQEALPAIKLTRRDVAAEEWQPLRDLLNSGSDAPFFVVEVDNDGIARLRFGDGEHGAAVAPGMRFAAVYRIGHGASGNVGAETLVHLVTADSRLEEVTNPLPATGGTEPETIEQVRQRAPFAFREEQRRAVTPADYARQAGRYAGVQRAVGTLRWTGSWHTMFVSVDRLSGVALDDAFESRMRAHLEPFRMAGVDLEIAPPKPVAFDLSLRVRVTPGYFRSHVAAALRENFTSRVRGDGRPGLFHPDHFSFAQTVYLSPWVAAAQAVDGVEAVEVVTFQRRDAPGEDGKNNGFITVGRLEVPVLENNPNFPERGTFELIMEGGK